MDDAGRFEARMPVVDLREKPGRRTATAARMSASENRPGPEAVVDVVRVVGDVVGERRRLRLEARMKREVEPLAPVVGQDRFAARRARGSAGIGRPEASRSGPLCLTRPAIVVRVRFRPSKSA